MGVVDDGGGGVLDRLGGRDMADEQKVVNECESSRCRRISRQQAFFSSFSATLLLMLRASQGQKEIRCVLHCFSGSTRANIERLPEQPPSRLRFFQFFVSCSASSREIRIGPFDRVLELQ